MVVKGTPLSGFTYLLVIYPVSHKHPPICTLDASYGVRSLLDWVMMMVLPETVVDDGDGDDGRNWKLQKCLPRGIVLIDGLNHRCNNYSRNPRPRRRIDRFVRWANSVVTHC